MNFFLFVAAATVFFNMIFWSGVAAGTGVLGILQALILATIGLVGALVSVFGILDNLRDITAL